MYECPSPGVALSSFPHAHADDSVMHDRGEQWEWHSHVYKLRPLNIKSARTSTWSHRADVMRQDGGDDAVFEGRPREDDEKMRHPQRADDASWTWRHRGKYGTNFRNDPLLNTVKITILGPSPCHNWSLNCARM